MPRAPRAGAREAKRGNEREREPAACPCVFATSGGAPLSRGGVPVLRATSCVSVYTRPQRRYRHVVSRGAAAGACMCDRGKARTRNGVNVSAVRSRAARMRRMPLNVRTHGRAREREGAMTLPNVCVSESRNVGDGRRRDIGAASLARGASSRDHVGKREVVIDKNLRLSLSLSLSLGVRQVILGNDNARRKLT